VEAGCCWRYRAARPSQRGALGADDGALGFREHAAPPGLARTQRPRACPAKDDSRAGRRDGRADLHGVPPCLRGARSGIARSDGVTQLRQVLNVAARSHSVIGGDQHSPGMPVRVVPPAPGHLAVICTVYLGTGDSILNHWTSPAWDQRPDFEGPWACLPPAGWRASAVVRCQAWLMRRSVVLGRLAVADGGARWR
jgi:hypothetical protein